MLQPYPLLTEFPRDDAAERAIAPVKAAILGARQIRGQLDVARSRQMPLHIKAASAADWSVIEAHVEVIRFLANVTDIAPVADENALPPTAMQLIDGHAIHAPLASLIDDPDAELSRLAKLKTKKRQELVKFEAKLGNQNFVANAPPEIVEQERARVVDLKREIAQIEEQERRVALLKR